MSQKTRNTALDFARGFAILCMIFDHIYGKGKFITSFHMPLFFIISGFLLKEETIGLTVKKRAKGLLWPYLKYALLAVVVGLIKNALYYHLSSRQNLVYAVTKTVNIFLGKDIWLLWFLLALFEATMIYVLIQKITKKPALRLLLSAIVSLVGFYFSMTTGTETPYYLDQGLLSVLFLAVGDFAKKVDFSHMKKSVKILSLIFAAIIWALGIHYGIFVMALRVFKGFPLSYISAIAATYVVVMLSDIFAKIPLLGPFIIWCGGTTLEWLCFGNIFRQFSNWASICRSFGVENYFFMFLIQAAIITLFVWLVKKGKTLARKSCFFGKKWHNRG